MIGPESANNDIVARITVDGVVTANRKFLRFHRVESREILVRVVINDAVVTDKYVVIVTAGYRVNAEAAKDAVYAFACVDGVITAEVDSRGLNPLHITRVHNAKSSARRSLAGDESENFVP